MTTPLSSTFTYTQRPSRVAGTDDRPRAPLDFAEAVGKGKPPKGGRL
jgi:hypothetical protein